MDLGAFLLEPSERLTQFALFVTRVFIGVCFIVHALGKLGIVGTGNMQGFASWLDSLGVPMAKMQAYMAMTSELVGGALLALGLFTRPACLVLIGTMIVAGWLGHKGAGYLITNDPPGAEYTINLAVICFLILVMGPGTVSLDYAIFS